MGGERDADKTQVVSGGAGALAAAPDDSARRRPDRGGTQQLYVLDLKGGAPRRISFGDGRYATPVWSPRGEKNFEKKSTDCLSLKNVIALVRM